MRGDSESREDVFDAPSDTCDDCGEMLRGERLRGERLRGEESGESGPSRVPLPWRAIRTA